VPAARADIFAVTDVQSGADTDLVLVDTSTAATGQLPAGVNTADNESHPSISSDGRRLVFNRRNNAGSDRIVLTDLQTGATSDLFTGFETAQVSPATPSITPDGTAVLTGGSHSGPLLTDVTSFPNGPYTHTDVGGRSPTLNPVASGSAPGSLLAFEQPHSGAQDFLFGTVGQTIFGAGGIAGTASTHPTIASPSGVETIVFSFASVTNGTVGNGRLEACLPAHPISAGCPKSSLPGTSSSSDETRPAFTPDGRYVGFIETHTGTGVNDSALAIWDSGTQEVISTSDLGQAAPANSGNLSLYERPILKQALILPDGVVRFNLLSGANIGILVQRVTGHRKLFGRSAPRLGRARRVPLGSFKRGHGHAHWNLEIAGHKLRPGTYQVTLRALTRSGRIRDLGKPRLLHVRRR
jgi:hypothetical protein